MNSGISLPNQVVKGVDTEKGQDCCIMSKNCLNIVLVKGGTVVKPSY